MSAFLKFEQLIIRNKNPSPENFEFTRFDCSSLRKQLYLGDHRQNSYLTSNFYINLNSSLYIIC